MNGTAFVWLSIGQTELFFFNNFTILFKCIVKVEVSHIVNRVTIV